MQVMHRRSSLPDAWAYRLAAGLLAVGVAHLGLQLLVGGPWTGPVSWRKPTTFGVSFGLTLATVTWISALAGVPSVRRGLVLRAFAAASTVEVAVITVQAWRGVPSHFNTTTPLNAALAYSAAGGGAVLIAATGVLLATVARLDPGVPPSMRLALRIGVGTFAAALGTGAAMIALGVTAARSGTFADAYAAAAPLKPAHGALMHGVLVLPALAWLATHTSWPEGRRVRSVALGCGGYLLTAATVPLAAATAGAARATWTGVAALGALGLAAAGLHTAQAVRHRGSGTAPAAENHAVGAALISSTAATFPRHAPGER